MCIDEINLKDIQGQLRLKLLSLYNQANAGHIGCSLSCIDLMLATLVLRKQEQDTFLLSKGHAAASLYTCLNYLGDLSDEELTTYYQNGTTLPAHPAPNKHQGIPFATGSLGHGLPIGTGIALANKLLVNKGGSTTSEGQTTSAPASRVFVLMSDGETNEGTTWEAAHFAVQNGLDNLVVLIDKNGLQGFDQTINVLGDTANAHTWRAMGFETLETDGHNVEELLAGLDELTAHPNGKPKLLIAKTVKGKGVRYMENQLEWHYRPMTAGQYEQACTDVNEQYMLASVL